MAKGASIKFKSYEQTIPQILEVLNLSSELKKYDKIILKPFLSPEKELSTPSDLTEQVLKFVLENKNPVSEVFMAEGADGVETEELFNHLGYKDIAEKYSIPFIDLNQTETEIVEHPDFTKFETIHYPKILRESFVISLAKLMPDPEIALSGSLSNMLGAFPSSKYSGFFSSTKNKIRKWPLRYAIHDIVTCKMPNFALLDNSEQGTILAGLPLEIDKQASRILQTDPNEVTYLKLIESSFLKQEEIEKKRQQARISSEIIQKE
ncbi:hypothetical protein CMI47_23130 [Candidatus Pacearchaeota archaeon]|nr:hypothetical protein [Candidatus Pacearchaeota archaeon]|tara:strand:- start:6765 stop:7556 length:792 start_codon:yes stop_codon:yes gene_type:complete